MGGRRTTGSPSRTWRISWPVSRPASAASFFAHICRNVVIFQLKARPATVRSNDEGSKDDGVPHPLGRPRGLGRHPDVGPAPLRGQDLTERCLRAEFGPHKCGGTNELNNGRWSSRPGFPGRKEVAMSVTTISPQRLAELCKAGRIDLIDVRTPVEFREGHVEHAR